MSEIRELLAHPANCMALGLILVLTMGVVWAAFSVRYCQRCGFPEGQCKCPAGDDAA